MPFLFNVNIIKTNGVTSNGNVSIGAVIQNSHTSNHKRVGTDTSFGDFSPALSLSVNNVIDTDISDQDQIANPSAPIAGQF